VRVSPGWVETEAAVALVIELVEKSGTDYDGARRGLMHAGWHPARSAGEA